MISFVNAPAADEGLLDPDIFYLGLVDGQRIFGQYHQIGQFADLYGTAIVFLKNLPSRVDGRRTQSLQGRNPFVFADWVAAGGQTVDGAPNQ